MGQIDLGNLELSKCAGGGGQGWDMIEGRYDSRWAGWASPRESLFFLAPIFTIFFFFEGAAPANNPFFCPRAALFTNH